MGASKESTLSSRDVLSFAAPCLKSRLLESSAVREGHGPGSLSLDLVHGVEVD